MVGLNNQKRRIRVVKVREGREVKVREGREINVAQHDGMVHGRPCALSKATIRMIAVYDFC